MKIPLSQLDNIKNSWPVFEDWLKDKMQKCGWMARPDGIELIRLWYEFCYENMVEIEPVILKEYLCL